MYKRMKKNKLGRTKSHRESLINNLLRSLFDNNYVVTTTPKAKVLKQEAMSLVEKGKAYKKDLSFRRRLQVILGNDAIVEKYSEYIKKDDAGIGLVRIGFRDGDNAEIARVYLLGLEKKKQSKGEKREEKKEQKKKVAKQKQAVEIDIDKKVDKTAVIKNKERARTRAGI